MKVELMEKYEISIGTVLIIKSDSVLHTGDTVDVGNNKYQIKEILQPTGAYDETKISVMVARLVKIPTKKALHSQGLAERGGFEPPHGNYPPAGIRSQSLQPLGYLSIFKS